MTAEVFARRNPTVHIGGDYDAFSESVPRGTDFFITEACEYKRSFLSLKPDLAIVLNTELDHTDCYRSEEEYRAAFYDFCALSESAVVFGDDPALYRVAQKKGYVTFGFLPHNDYTACNAERLPKGGRAFDLCEQGTVLTRVQLQVFGEHNVLNALASAAAGRVYGLTADEIAEGLARFGGVGRRFEYLGTVANARVYSDYAHHPTELAALIKTARETGVAHVTIVFEPHTYTRTNSLCADFAKSLSAADSVYLLPIYAAREKPVFGVSSNLIADEMKRLGKPAVYKKNRFEIFKRLVQDAAPDRIIVFAGAGTVDGFGREFVECS